jgi:hypothetical protein
MPRVHRVAHAQQRYARAPVTDPAGNQVIVPVSRTGKGGKGVVMRRTQRDLSQPLDPYTCDFCGEPIEPGTAYKWIAPKSGPYSSRTLRRHASHPDWRVWEYSDSLSAQLAQVSYTFQEAVSSAESAEDVESALEDAAGEIESIADAKDEAADNMESGFGGHEIQPATDLHEIAEQLRSWADEIRNTEPPDFPEPEETDCDDCEGEGAPDCKTCGGSGTYTPDEPTDDQVDQWRDDVSSEVTIVDESPV